MKQHSVPGLLSCDNQYESTRGILIHLQNVQQHQAWLRQFHHLGGPGSFKKCPDCDTWLPDMFWWVRHLQTHRPSDSDVTVSCVVTRFTGDPALDLGVVRPLLIVRKSGRVNVKDFENTVRSSATYWRDLLQWMRCETGDIPIIRANGICTLHFPQPERAVNDRVRYVNGQPKVLFPDLEQTRHVAHQRAAFLKTTELLRPCQDINMICQQGFDGLTCTWPLLVIESTLYPAEFESVFWTYLDCSRERC